MAIFDIPADQPMDLESLQNEGEAFELRRIVAELASRKMEALRLYEPMPIQAGFHASMARERVIRSGNQAGKTTTCAVETARCVTGCDPYGRYPKRDGICYCVGFDGRHLADPMWKKLGKPGAFRMIRDLQTNQWRSYRPWLSEDLVRVAESKPAPPLIPPRMIQSISWELKKESQPKIVTLTNGWQIHFYSGNAMPAQGSQIDFAWFDEELPNESWYSEVAARLVFRRGYFIWSATPQVGTDRLYTLHERAMEQVEKNTTPRTVEEFVIHIDGNLYMTAEQKQEFIDKLDEDDRDIRVEGQFAGVHRVFPEYNPKIHEIPFREIPHSWTRYIGIDPGRQFCACLFLAVPPAQRDTLHHVYLYDELYLRDCDAVMFAEGMRLKCRDQQFRAFIIDPNEAPKHDTGSGFTVEEQYKRQLRERDIKSELSGHGFIYGDDDRRAAFESIRAWVKQRSSQHLQGERTPVLRVIGEKCPNFSWEMRHLKYKKVGNVITDDPDERKRTHLVACLRYLCQYRPIWVPPPKRDSTGGMAYKAYLRKQEKADKGGGILLGPGR